MIQDLEISDFEAVQGGANNADYEAGKEVALDVFLIIVVICLL